MKITLMKKGQYQRLVGKLISLAHTTPNETYNVYDHFNCYDWKLLWIFRLKCEESMTLYYNNKLTINIVAHNLSMIRQNPYG